MIITSTLELELACAELTKSNFVTVDTEFLRDVTFWPQLCLIQIATPKMGIIIDPLDSEINLSAFFNLMLNPSIVKVFHAARQDIEIIFHMSRQIPTPIFDTQVAAMVCGFRESISYDTLVRKLLGQQIDKSSRFTNWHQRPLSSKQLDYALADVTYLCEIYTILKAELEQTKRSEWLKEEMSILENPQTYNLPPEEIWKRIKNRLKKPQELAVLKYITTWREHEARSQNVPRNRIIKDETLIEIAQQQPRTSKDIEKLRSIHGSWKHSDQSKKIIEAVNTALALPINEMPQPSYKTPYSEESTAATELLKVLLKLTCEKNKVAPKLIANGNDLEKIATEGDKANVIALSGWRREIFGEKALKMISGHLALGFLNNRIEEIKI